MVDVACRTPVGHPCRSSPSAPQPRWPCTGGCCRPCAACRCRPCRSRRACSTPPGTAGRWCRTRSGPTRRVRRAAACERSTMRLIAASQSVSTSSPPVRTSGLVSRSGEWLACQPKRSFGIDPTVVDPVAGPTTHTDDAAVLHGDVQRVAVGVQDRRRLHPPFHGLRSDTGRRDACRLGPASAHRRRTGCADPTARRSGRPPPHEPARRSQHPPSEQPLRAALAAVHRPMTTPTWYDLNPSRGLPWRRSTRLIGSTRPAHPDAAVGRRPGSDERCAPSQGGSLTRRSRQDARQPLSCATPRTGPPPPSPCDPQPSPPTPPDNAARSRSSPLTGSSVKDQPKQPSTINRHSVNPQPTPKRRASAEVTGARPAKAARLTFAQGGVPQSRTGSSPWNTKCAGMTRDLRAGQEALGRRQAPVSLRATRAPNARRIQAMKASRRWALTITSSNASAPSSPLSRPEPLRLDHRQLRRQSDRRGRRGRRGV